ncbi:MAG: type II toxin-antitoxin system VapC family toxin [Cytophagales bacterium]|nr:type II toxin-antitoxin system VapC family toxin [Cytophagales bacterium]
MSGNNILLDTNAIIAVLDGHPVAKEIINLNVLHISFITELESLSYQKLTTEDRHLIRNFLNECILLELNSDIKETAIDLRIKYKLKLPDAIIAATANYYQLPLVSADKVFSKVKEIENIRFI